MSTVATNPYSDYLAGRDALASLEDSTERLARLVRGWTPERMERSYAAGKWTARQIVLHLAQTELAFGNRARLALSTPDYVVQPFNQDTWVALEEGADREAALEAFLGLRRLDLALFRKLTPAERATTFRHPERGTLSVDWIITLLAGHDLHHLRQLEEIGAQPADS